MKIKNLSQIIFLLMLVCSLASCDVFDSIGKDAADVIQEAIDSLVSEADDYEKILLDLEQDLERIPDLEREIADDVKDISTRTIAQAGVEFKCSADFIGNRVKDELQSLKDEILGRETSPPKPSICTLEPVGGVDLRRVRDGNLNNLIFYGYNFDTQSPPKVQLISQSNVREISEQYVSSETHYHLAINLSNLNRDNYFDDLTVNQLKLTWNSEVLSTININQPVCELETKRIPTSQVLTVIPSRTNGDDEFGGNGPRIFTDTRIEIRGNAIVATVIMEAYEYDGSYGDSIAKGTRSTTLATATSGFAISRILTDEFVEKNYIDNDHSVDTFTGSGPVKRYTFIGDTDGDDIGQTRVDVEFNAFQYEQVEQGVCINN